MIEEDKEKIEEIFSKTNIGLEVEFFSRHEREDVADMLSELLGKEILIADKHHDDEVKIDDKTYKIEPDYSGGKSMIELITWKEPYSSFRETLSKILGWIQSHGSTDHTSSIHLNISFDELDIPSKKKLENLDTLKFILKFDEERIYTYFPNRRKSVYSRSIKYLRPVTKFNHSDKIINTIDRHSYIVPSEKYYGVNFSKLLKGYLEFRYIGGKDYEYKEEEIVELLDYFILHTYSIAYAGVDYTDDDIEAINQIVAEHNRISMILSTYESFKKFAGKKIELTVNLLDNPQMMKIYFGKIREKLYDILVFTDFISGKINYDSDIEKFQIKDASLSNAFFLTDCHIINSRVSGNIDRCEFWNSTVTGSIIKDGILHGGNIIEKSKIVNTPVGRGVICRKCYIDAKKFYVNGNIVNSIIRSGKITKGVTVVDSQTDIVDNPSDETERPDGGVKKIRKQFRSSTNFMARS